MSARTIIHADVRRQGESGNVILLALILVGLLAAFSAAQLAVVQKNIRASSFISETADLRKYAESGVDLALHDLTFGLSANPGQIGTSAWTTVDDVGMDGIPGTADQGEGDGIPSHGEPNVIPVPVGDGDLGALLSVHVADSGFPGIVRVVATASNSTASSTVDTFARTAPLTLPRAGAIYVDEGVALDFRGNSFLVDGRDHALDETVLSTPATPGISTPVGDPAGSNQITLLSQLPTRSYTQIQGLGGTPSLGEDPIDLDALIASLKPLTTNVLEPGNYSSTSIGNPALGVLPVTRVPGDLHLAGNTTGGGVLLIDGSLTMTGQFSFQGLIIVTGDVRLSGGGAGIQVLGSLMVKQSLTAIELETEADTKLSGNSKVYFSSEAIDRAQAALPNRHSVVYYDDK